MFQFLYPSYLHLLWLLPVVVLLYVWSCMNTRKRLSKLGQPSMVLALMPGHSVWRRHIKFALVLMAAALLIVAVARPQYGLKQQTETTQGIEAVVMVDVSNSMMANDVQPSRLDRAKLLVSNLADRMAGDKIALGVFAGEAYPQLPMTSDHAAAKLFIDAISTGMVSLQGTNLAAAIELAQKSFTDNKDVGKAIMLITDGENHEGGAEEAAAAAAKEGINIYVIGVGTSTGSIIPTTGGAMTDYEGTPIHTALNEDMCREVAKAGKGIYLHLDQTNSAQEELQSQLARLKRAGSTTSYTARDEQFQAVALLALLLLVLEICIYETQNPFFKRFKLFTK